MALQGTQGGIFYGAGDSAPPGYEFFSSGQAETSVDAPVMYATSVALYGP